MFNFDLSSVSNRLLGLDNRIISDISGGITSIVKTYYKEKEAMKESCKNDINCLEIQLSSARDSIRRLNRRSQKFEKENVSLKKTLKKNKKGYDELSKSLSQKNSQINLLTLSLNSLHDEAKKNNKALFNWKKLSKILYSQKFYGNVITYPAERGVATVYVLKDNKIPDKCEKAQIKSGTAVHCIRQDSRYVLIDFIQCGKIKRGYIPANNIRLSTKPPSLKIVNSVNPNNYNKDICVVNANNLNEKKK